MPEAQHNEPLDEVRMREVKACHVGDLIHIGDSVGLSPWTAENYLDELKNPDAVMLRLVSPENKTLGFIVGRLVGSEASSIDAEIYNIAVKQSAQKKGNGQLLLNAFTEQCRGKGVRTIWLEVRESNSPAINFYQKNGFIFVQRRSHFYSNPREHGWLMSLNLMQTEA